MKQYSFFASTAALASLAVSMVCYAAGGPAKPGAGPASPDRTEGISVMGHVRFEGQPPKLAHTASPPDPSCPKSATGVNEEFVTGANGSLANVVVYISDGLNQQSFDVPAEPAVIEQKGCLYEPHVLAFRTNQTLKVINDDKTMHNIHPMPSNNREWNKAEPAGAIVEEKFAREEVGIPVKCNVHPWMRSYLAVFKHPFFAVTGKDGSFDLRNLPPGEYTLQAWHEKLGTMTQKITIVAGQPKTVDFDFKGSAH